MVWQEACGLLGAWGLFLSRRLPQSPLPGPRQVVPPLPGIPAPAGERHVPFRGLKPCGRHILFCASLLTSVGAVLCAQDLKLGQTFIVG